MKKLLSIIITFMLVLSSTGMAFAKQTNQTSTTVTNEYLQIKELKKLSDEELKQKGLNESDINRLRNLDYAKELKERAKLDEQTLKNYGYSDDQIQKLKNFKGSEDEIVALAATMTVNMYYYAGGTTDNGSAYYSYLTCSYDWNWSAVPILKMTDMLAWSWTGGFSFDRDTNSSYSKITYQSIYNTNQQTTKTYYPTLDSSLYGAFVKFPVEILDSNRLSMWSKSGYGKIKIYKTSSSKYVGEVTNRMAYAHNQFSPSPSVSFPKAGSISFSTGLIEQAADWVTKSYS